MAPKKRRNIVVGDETWKQLKALGKTEERSMSELIREALQDLFTKRTRPASMKYDPISDKYRP